MRLTVGERLAVQGLLPKESNFITLRVLNRLREELSFDEDEIKALSLTESGGQVSWNPEVDGKGIEVEIGDLATQIIHDALVALDKESKLTAQHVTLYEKFVVDSPQ